MKADFKALAGLLPAFTHFSQGETHYMVSLNQPLPGQVAAIVTNAPGIVRLENVPAADLVDVIKLGSLLRKKR